MRLNFGEQATRAEFFALAGPVVGVGEVVEVVEVLTPVVEDGGAWTPPVDDVVA
jgi:hypothetical protein